MVRVRVDGSLLGLVVTDELLINLAAIRSDGHILPQSMMSVAKISLPGNDVAVVEVQPSDLPPVRFKGRVQYGEETLANFPARNSYRNPVIAESLKSPGFVNRFGYGVQREQALPAENGNPPSKFQFDEHSVLVKVHKRP